MAGTIAEARELQALIRSGGWATARSPIPGAERSAASCSRAMSAGRRFKPKVWPRYSGVTGDSVVTAYEDRRCMNSQGASGPAGGIVADFAAGGRPGVVRQRAGREAGQRGQSVLIAEGPDVVRAKLAPRFHAWFDEFTATEGFRATRERCNRPAAARRNSCALCWKPCLRPARRGGRRGVRMRRSHSGRPLRQHPQVAGLAAYGGWNTAGNTLERSWPRQ